MTKQHKNLWRRGRTWYVHFKSGDTRILQSTGETTLDKASAKRDEILAPFNHRDKAETLAALQGLIDHHAALAAKLEAERRPGTPIPRLWPLWMDTAPTASPATLRQYEVQLDIFRRWIADTYPEATAEEISGQISAAFVRKLETDKRSPGTINKYLNLLSQVWRAVLPENPDPWAKIEKRKGEVHSRRPLTKAELAAVLGVADAEMRVLLLLGALLALRLGDACMLKWGDVDLERGIITVKPRKTKSRTAKVLTLPIVGALGPALDSIPQGKAKDFVLPRFAADYQRHATYVTDRIQKLFTDLKIETRAERDTGGRRAVDVGFHSLRHALASTLVEANAPAAVAQAILGHASPALLRTYQHVGQKQIHAALADAARLLPAHARR